MQSDMSACKSSLYTQKTDNFFGQIIMFNVTNSCLVLNLIYLTFIPVLTIEQLVHAVRLHLRQCIFKMRCNV